MILPRLRVAVVALCLAAGVLAGCSEPSDAGASHQSTTTSPAATASSNPTPTATGSPTAAAGSPADQLTSAIDKTVAAMPDGVTTKLAAVANMTGSSVVTCTTIVVKGDATALERAVVQADVVPDSYADNLNDACSAPDTTSIASAQIADTKAWTRPPNRTAYRSATLTEAGRTAIATALASSKPWALFDLPGTKVTAGDNGTLVAKIPIASSGESGFAPFDAAAGTLGGSVAGWDGSSFTLTATVTLKDGRLARIETSAPELAGQGEDNVHVIETISYGTPTLPALPTDSAGTPLEVSSLAELLNVG